jgi:hypothetical protein
MNWTNSPAAENQPGRGRSGAEAYVSTASASLPPPAQPGTQPQAILGTVKSPEIRIGKCHSLSAVAGSASGSEVFTLTLGSETIELLPLRHWNQLDHYKWTVRGRLPGEPAGLEIAVDHIKIAGGTVALNDPAGCIKLEQLFNEWLLFERQTLELARKKARPQQALAGPAGSEQTKSEALRFRVEVDKRGQVHIHCVQGKNLLASVGLSAAGINSLHQQGFMRKPHKLATGALHDWIELDGEMCSFEKGRNDAARLEQVLNERYVPEATAGRGKEVVVFLNPASSTGFDIQFPVMVAGTPDNHRHHLNDHSLDLLQDADHCGLLHKGIIIKLIPPNLVFKQKTPDGGEQYLPWTPENTVTVTDEEGHQKTLQLYQPLNLLRLSAAELTAVFNHTAINRHAKAAPPSSPAGPLPKAAAAETVSPTSPPPPPFKQEPVAEGRQPTSDMAPPKPPAERAVQPAPVEHAAVPAVASRPLPNAWLKQILAQPALPHEWFACLTYTKLAQRFGNSFEGQFGPSECWFIALGESEDIADPAFKGLFITEKGSLGFLKAGQMARFRNRVAFIGTRESALEGIQVDIVAIGLDAQERIVFILSDNYRAQFGVRDTELGEVLNRLREHGAVIMSIREALASADPLEVVWTVPAEQSDPASPEALESTRPS